MRVSGISLLASGVLACLLTACAPAGTATVTTNGRTLMSPGDVITTFVGDPWGTDTGTYEFDAAGTYSFVRRRDGQRLGPWPYVVLDDGQVRGPTATFVFFRTANGYEYYNAETDQFLRAYPEGAP